MARLIEPLAWPPSRGNRPSTNLENKRVISIRAVTHYLT